MILQSLSTLYKRLVENEKYGLPVPGQSVQNITFCIVLDSHGTLINIEDARKEIVTTLRNGKTKTSFRPRQVLVPGDEARSGKGMNPFTLCDNTSYLLGYKKPDKSAAKTEKEAARAALTFEASRTHHLSLEKEISDPAYSAICRFLENWEPQKAADWADRLNDFAATGFGLFKVNPSNSYAHQSDTLKKWWASKQTTSHEDDIIATCLVTGEESPIARLAEPAIKGVNGAAQGGAKLASFNLKAFESYGKNQTYNSPVSKKATFQYCNALNALLSGPESKKHRVAIGDTTTIFWSERESYIENIFASLMSGYTPDSDIETAVTEDPAKHQELAAFLSLLRTGGGSSLKEIGEDPNSRFYILGLAGNVTRLSVRFWHVSTVQEMADRLRSHYQAFSIAKSFPSDPEFPPPIRLLDQTARERKAISPLLGGQLMQSILKGGNYPLGLYNGVLNRLRSNDELTYLKVGILKAVLIRNFNQTITMSLDPDRPDTAYLLGRLFAALEKTQEDALGKVNAGIREKFYSSASATPGSVFPRIIRNYNHLLAKLKGGMKTNREKLIQQIHEKITDYPKHLTLEEQGLFAIGYYHQRQDFYTKKDSPETNPSL